MTSLPPREPAAAPALGAVVAVIAVGGALGSLARWGLAEAFPHRPDGLPWATLAINAVGSLLLGLLMARISARPAHPLLRPFLGIGVLGGFTTFSGQALETHALLRHEEPLLALAYLLGTLVLCLQCAAMGLAMGRWLLAHTSPAGGSDAT